MEIPTHTVINNASEDEHLATRIIDSIRQVYDPEIPVNVFDLGLIYEINIEEDYNVFIKMTLTAPNCPAANILPGQVEMAAGYTDGVENAEVVLTFDPPFGFEMMSDEARLTLGFM